MNQHLKLLAGAVALCCASTASQAATEWILASNYGAISSGVTVSAVSNTGAGNTPTDNALGDSQTIAAATWTNTWGGIYNADACGSATGCDSSETVSPEHAIDNNERYDMALLSFTSAVNLTNIRLGYYNTDSDITVMAYTGAGTPVLTGKTYAQLASSGWTLVGHYADIGPMANSTVSTGSSVYSSYWLVGAYNPLVGGSTGWSTGNDYVKLASVTGNTCTATTPGCSPSTRVPEPGSLALLGVGLLGLIRYRKIR